MKIQSVNNIAKKLLLVSFLSAILFLSAQSNALADGNYLKSTPSNTTDNPKTIFVKYVGSTQDGLFFNVKYSNEKGQDFDILITDEHGETLYEGSFNDKFFDKKFLLPEDSDASLVSISIKSGKDNFVKTYSINDDIVKNVVVLKK